MRFAGEGTVQEPDLIERNIGRIFALVLLAIGTAGYSASTGKLRHPWACTRSDLRCAEPRLRHLDWAHVADGGTARRHPS